MAEREQVKEINLAPVIGGLIGIMMVFMLASVLQAATPTPPLNLPYCCPYCGQCFATQDELTAHIQAQHPGPGIVLCGKVIEQVTGNPIANANVDAYVENIGHRGAFTDSGGNYRIENLVEGRAFVTVTAEGYETWTQWINITAPETRVDWALTPVTAPPQADFSIEITGASNTNPQVGEYVAIYYKVKNVSTVPAVFGHIDYANGTPFASVPLQGQLLSPGQTYEGSITVGKTVPGTTVFQIAVTTCPHPDGTSCGHGYIVLKYSNTITITWG